jgi:hypothetical protein
MNGKMVGVTYVTRLFFQTTVDTKSGKKKKTYEHGIIEPLSKSQSSAAGDTIDPLSMFAAESATTVAKKSTGVSVCCFISELASNVLAAFCIVALM